MTALTRLFKKARSNSVFPETGNGLYYGWVVLVACMVIGTFSTGIRFSFGVFFKSIESDFGLNRAATSGIMSLYMLLCCVSSVVGGWALDRYGPKKVLILSGVFTGIGLLLTGVVTSLWQLYLTYSFFMAMGTGSVNSILLATTSRWFTRKRGLTLGIVSSSTSIGMILVAPMASILISSYGWQTSYLILSLIVMAFWIPCSLLVKRESRRNVAFSADISEKREKSVQSPGGPEGLSLLQSMKTRDFWFFFFQWITGGFGVFTMMTHVVPRAQDAGLTPSQAALILSIIGVTSLVARVLMGRIADIKGKKPISAICTITMALALLGLVWASSPEMFYLDAVIWGLGLGGVVPATNALLIEIFGMRHIGIILGFLDTGFAIGSALGPAFAGYIFDTAGNYIPAFSIAAGVMFVSAWFVFFLISPAVKSRTS